MQIYAVFKVFLWVVMSYATVSIIDTSIDLVNNIPLGTVSMEHLKILRGSIATLIISYSIWTI